VREEEEQGVAVVPLSRERRRKLHCYGDGYRRHRYPHNATHADRPVMRTGMDLVWFLSNRTIFCAQEPYASNRREKADDKIPPLSGSKD
jgi:hypothetical protein